MSIAFVARVPLRASLRIAALAACGAVIAGGHLAAAPPSGPRAAPPVARPKVIVDRDVVPAGLGCRQCRGGLCPLHGGHAGECRDGRCAPHCPVRPSEYGFYRTQWRRWPGQGVVPASAEQAATPAPPPASQVPTADEESPRTPDEDLPPAEAVLPPEGDAADVPAGDAGAKPDGQADEKAGEKAKEKANDPDAPLPAPLPPGDEGLFDPVAEPPADTGAMRQPASVGRWLAASGPRPTPRQRPADSARGL